MPTTSAVPESARATLGIIDGALEYLAKHRMDYFIKYEEKEKKRRKSNNKYLGFEDEWQRQLISCLDKPGVEVFYAGDKVAVPGRRRIDLAVSFAECTAFVELGIWYHGFRKKYGGEDCRKILDKLDRQRTEIGVLIHFHFYEDWDDRIHKYFRQELPDTELGERYWYDFREVPDDVALPRHFVRLAFGLNAVVCSPPSR